MNCIHEGGEDPIGCIVEVELSGPIPALPSVDPVSGVCHRTCLTIVRLHTRPIGTFQTPLGDSGLSSREHAARIWQEVGSAIEAHLEADGLPVPDGLTDAGLPTPSAPPCCQAYQDFLSDAPAASIIISTRDRVDDLEACLASLLELDYPEYEIVVVDNAPSTGATRDLVEGRYAATSRVVYAVEPRPGLSSARNRGVLVARHDLLAFTDDDVVVDRQWLAQLLRPLAVRPEVGCVTGLVVPRELATESQLLFEQYGEFGKGFSTLVFSADRSSLPDLHFPFSSGRVGNGSNMAYRRSVLEAIELFDPALGVGTPSGGGEDLAAFYQTIQAGHSIVYEPAALVYHKHRREMESLRHQLFCYGSGMTAFLTSCVVRDPGLLVRDVLPTLPAALNHLLSPSSPKQVKRGSTFPRELSRLEQKGMFYGPLAYLRGRWDLARRRGASTSAP